MLWATYCRMCENVLFLGVAFCCWLLPSIQERLRCSLRTLSVVLEASRKFLSRCEDMINLIPMADNISQPAPQF